MSCNLISTAGNVTASFHDAQRKSKGLREGLFAQPRLTAGLGII
jgi:hypothetical protein